MIEGGSTRDGARSPWWHGPRSEAARVLLRYAGLGLLAFLVVGAGASALSVHLVRTQELRRAERDGRAMAEATLAPLVDQDVYDGDAVALTRLDERVRLRESASTLAGVDVFAADGVLLYSDQQQLIGHRAPIDVPGHQALDGGGVQSRLSGPPGLEQNLEVSARVRDREGRPILVETYYAPDRLRSQEEALLARVLPAVLGALLAFGLAVLLAPPTVGLGRRLVRYEREQHALVRLALEARSAERRRVAAELHDGVNQDLTGVGYALNTLDAQILGLAGAAPPPPSALRHTLGGAARLVHDNLLALRELTGLRYAADSGAAEPAPALRVVADELRAKGARITTEIGPLPPLPQAHRAALIRAGREALRNAVQHAPEASTALRLGTDPGGGAVVLTVADDGPGFDPLSAPGTGRRPDRAGPAGRRGPRRGRAAGPAYAARAGHHGPAGDPGPPPGRLSPAR